MITAKLLLYTHDPETKRGYPVKILLTKDRKTKKIHLKRYSELKHWDKKKEEPKRSNPDKQLSFFIAQQKRDLVFTINYANENRLTLAQTIEVFEKGVKNDITPIKVSKLFNTRIAELEEEGKAVRLYKTVRDLIRVFGDTTIDRVDYNYVRELCQYRSDLKPNALHAYLRTFKALYNEAVRRGLTEDKTPFAGNMPKLQRTPKKAVFQEDLDKICQDKNRQVQMWLLMFYLGGMDLVDLASLNWSQYRKGRIYYQRYKLRGTGMEIDIKVFPKAKAIIDEFGTVKHERIFGFIPDPKTEKNKYANYRSNALKRHLSKLKTERPITFKSARHTFRSIGRRLMVDGDILRELMGHESGGVEYIYQDRFTEQQRDEAHGAIIKG